jgi:predicted Zn-dependent protease
MSTWGLLAVTALVLALLAIVFPAGTLEKELRGNAGPDPVAAEYLENMVRGRPEDTALRVALARQQAELGRIEQALATLDPLTAADDAAIRRDALRQRFELLRTHAFAQPEGSPARSAALGRARAALSTLAREDADTATLAALAQQAAAIGDAGTTAALYARLAQRADASADMLARGAAALLAEGDYRAAAKLHFLAQERAPSREARRDQFLAGVAALQAGNLLGEALDAADAHLGDLAGDDHTLMTLARLALAANDTARAQRYARALMRMGDAVQAPALLRALHALFGALVASAHAAEPAVALRPYDEAIYRLAFDVFVGGGQLDDAYRVAAAAVRQRPDDLVWRERLAQVAEWSGRPVEALEQWTFLAQRGSDRARQGVLRLAPGLNADDALLAVWLATARTRPLTREESLRVAALFETLGEPREAIAFFEAQERRRPDAVNLELIAALNERSGRVPEAIAAYERLAAVQPLDDAGTLALTGLHMKRGDFQRAFDVLAQRRSQAGDDEEFWRLYGELAWQLQRDDAAGDAYARLAKRGQARAFELQRLVNLLRRDRPQDAARLAEAGWTRFADPLLLLAALDLHAQRGDGVSQDRLFAALAPADDARFAGQPYFFLLRANRQVARGRIAAAEADFGRALAMAPSDPSVRASWLWFLVEHGRPQALRAAMRETVPLARTEPQFWAPLAAGHLALGEPAAALGWLRRELASRQNDYLWLLTYAEALEQDGQAGMAARVRRHAWHTLRAAAAQDKRLLENREATIAAARLALTQAPGDPAAAAIRLVLRQDDAVPTADRPVAARAQDAAARELVLSWALSGETNDAARAWMWREYGRRLARPAWAEAALALEDNDFETMDRLLADARAPVESRVEMARTMGRYRTAQTLGFAAATTRDRDDDLHTGLADDLRRTAPSLVLRQTMFDYRPLRGDNTFVAAPLWLGERLRLAPFYSLTLQSSRDEDVLTRVPSRDQHAGLALLWRERRHQTELVVGQRDAADRFGTGMLLHGRDLSRRLRGTLRLALNDRASDTAALLVGGMKDEARGTLQYAFSKREYATLGASLQRFDTQAGTRLGDGDRIDLEVGHRLRTEYPDLLVRAYAAHQRYRPEGATDAVGARLNPDGTIPDATFFLPQSFSYYSATIGFGEYLRGQPFQWDRFGEEPFSRALRPFASVGIGYNTITGTGFNGLVGIAGSVLGSDQLALYFLTTQGGTGTFTRASELVLRYQYYF